jgi:MFS family permease
MPDRLGRRTWEDPPTVAGAVAQRRFGFDLAVMGAALRIPPFRLLWLSLLPGTLGMMMAVVAFGYLAYQLSGSTTTLALVNAGWGLPMFVLSPLAGLAADRFPRRNVLLITQGIVGVTAVVAAALVLTERIQVWHLILVTVTQGAAFAFNIPARQALIAELVGRDDLANALALYNAGVNLNRVAGPAIGGALLTIPALGAGGVFVVMAGLYILVLLMLQRLPPTTVLSAGPPAGQATGHAPEQATQGGEERTAAPERRPARAAARVRSLAQLAVGLRYVAARPALRSLMLLAFLPLLFGMPYQALMPAVAAQTFQVDAAGLGALSAANGLGALAGSVALAAVIGQGLRLTHVQYGSGLAFGGSLVAFALCSAFVPALGLVALVGAASAAYTSVNNTLLMSQTPPEFHGRVMGVYMMTFAAMPLSSVPAAWVADLLGLPMTLAASGALTALAVVAIGGRRPAD